MHHALQVAEIFTLICTFTDRRTVARLLRTCHTFEERSRRVLWKKLDSLYPFICLLPDSVLGDAKASFSGATPLPELLLSDDQWQRIRKYTSCVIDLRIEPSPKTNDDVLLGRELDVLASLKPPVALAPLFPNLRTIRAGGGRSRKVTLYLNESTVSFLNWLDRQAVTELELILKDPELLHADPEFVGSLGTFFPNATRVALEVDDAQYYPQLNKAICDWKHLVHASFLARSIQPVAYKHLSQLESLTSLHLRNGHTGDASASSLADTLTEDGEQPHPCFPALTKILLEVPKFSIFASWIKHYHLPLTSVAFSGWAYMDHEEPHELFSSLSSQIDHKSLRTVHLFADRNRRSTQRTARTYSIQPLFIFTNLREVTISWLWVFSMNDADLGDIARAWPLLEVLDLHRCNVAYLEGSRPMATLRGLFSLVKSCPRLRELSMMLDATDHTWIDLDQTNDSDRVCSRTLSKLVIVHSPLYHAKRVAAIIHAKFPSLKQVDLGDWESLMECLGEKMKKGEIPTARLSLWYRVNTHLGKLRGSA